MNDDLGGFFALPPFKADEALVGLRRQLRELKPLTEKTGSSPHRFDIKGLPVIELSLSDDQAVPAVVAASVKRPSQRPEWQKQPLKSSADVRRFVDEVKRKLKAWEDED